MCRDLITNRYVTCVIGGDREMAYGVSFSIVQVILISIFYILIRKGFVVTELATVVLV